MIYYPDQPFNARYSRKPITNEDREIRDAIQLRNTVLSERLGISIDMIKNLLDDHWCQSNRETVAILLNVRCDYNSSSPWDRM